MTLIKRLIQRIQGRQKCKALFIKALNRTVDNNDINSYINWCRNNNGMYLSDFAILALQASREYISYQEIVEKCNSESCRGTGSDIVKGALVGNDGMSLYFDDTIIREYINKDASNLYEILKIGFYLYQQNENRYKFYASLGMTIPINAPECYRNISESAQQVDSAEPRTNAVRPSMPSGSAR